MDNVSPWIHLAGISDHQLTIWGLILAILGISLTAYLGYTYVKKVNRQNKKDLDRAKQDIIDANAQSAAKIERCINEHVSSQNRQANSFCKKIAEDARRLQNSASNYDRGLSKAALGDLDGAEDEFNKAIELQLPVLSKYYFQRGNMRYIQNKFKEACIDYSEAIRINPQLATAWANKAGALIRLDKYQDGLDAAEKAIELDPKLAIAWVNKAGSFGSIRQ